MSELQHNVIRWPMIFTLSRGYRLLHDVRLLAKPKQPESYAMELWTIMLSVRRFPFSLTILFDASFVEDD